MILAVFWLEGARLERETSQGVCRKPTRDAVAGNRCEEGVTHWKVGAAGLKGEEQGDRALWTLGIQLLWVIQVEMQQEVK